MSVRLAKDPFWSLDCSIRENFNTMRVRTPLSKYLLPSFKSSIHFFLLALKAYIIVRELVIFCYYWISSGMMMRDTADDFNYGSNSFLRPRISSD